MEKYTKQDVIKGFKQTVEMFGPAFQDKNCAMVAAACMDGDAFAGMVGDKEDLRTAIVMLIRDYCKRTHEDPEEFCKDIPNIIYNYDLCTENLRTRISRNSRR